MELTIHLSSRKCKEKFKDPHCGFIMASSSMLVPTFIPIEHSNSHTISSFLFYFFAERWGAYHDSQVVFIKVFIGQGKHIFWDKMGRHCAYF